MPKNPKAPDPWIKPEHRVGFLLRSLQHTLRQAMDDALRKQGIELSFAAFVALFGLHKEPGITGAQLARRAFVSAQTMNAALHRLELEGRIERGPHPDSRRADSWSLTPAGLAELERAHSLATSVFTKMLSSFDADEMELFSDYMRRCIDALGGDVTGLSARPNPPQREPTTPPGRELGPG
jgi:DNA-binding MarR family transcriptional regulator